MIIEGSGGLKRAIKKVKDKGVNSPESKKLSFKHHDSIRRGGAGITSTFGDKSSPTKTEKSEAKKFMKKRELKETVDKAPRSKDNQAARSDFRKKDRGDRVFKKYDRSVMAKAGLSTPEEDIKFKKETGKDPAKKKKFLKINEGSMGAKRLKRVGDSQYKKDRDDGSFGHSDRTDKTFKKEGYKEQESRSRNKGLPKSSQEKAKKRMNLRQRRRKSNAPILKLKEGSAGEARLTRRLNSKKLSKGDFDNAIKKDQYKSADRVVRGKDHYTKPFADKQARLKSAMEKKRLTGYFAGTVNDKAKKKASISEGSSGQKRLGRVVNAQIKKKEYDKASKTVKKSNYKFADSGSRGDEYGAARGSRLQQKISNKEVGVRKREKKRLEKNRVKTVKESIFEILLQLEEGSMGERRLDRKLGSQLKKHKGPIDPSSKLVKTAKRSDYKNSDSDSRAGKSGNTTKRLNAQDRKLSKNTKPKHTDNDYRKDDADNKLVTRGNRLYKAKDVRYNADGKSDR